MIEPCLLSVELQTFFGFCANWRCHDHGCSINFRNCYAGAKLLLTAIP